MVSLNELIGELDELDMDFNTYYNPEENEFFCDEYSDFSDLTEDEIEALYEKSILLPSKYDIDEYSMMEEYIENIENEKISSELYNSIKGKGAFRRFKDTCIYFGIIDNWYRFKEEKLKEIAIEWCKDNKLKYIDDMKHYH